MEFFTQVSWSAVGAAFLASMLLSMLWYGPLLFGYPWIRLVGRSDRVVRRSTSSSFSIGSFATLLAAYAVAVLLSVAEPQSMTDALIVTLLLVLSVTLPGALSCVAWEGRPWALFFINAGGQTAGILLMVTIVYWLQNVYAMI